MSKAFDKVNHFGLYLKLMKRNIPPKFLLVSMNWYSKCSALVRWNGVFSSAFNIPCGVRQGGVLSPVLFNIYVNDIIDNLSSSQLGCSICNMYVGCVMYADDLLLMSASLTILQKMIDICVAEACYLDMKFNATKSMVMRIGQGFRRVCNNVNLDGRNLLFVDKVRYLGIFIKSDKIFKICTNESTCRYFRSVNGIII